MKITVVYAMADRQIVRELDLPEGSTIAAALGRTGFESDLSEMELRTATIGIFGRVMGRQSVLQAGDRVEIYRALQADPKVARRKRAIRR
jgi:putative ubiquitin-RnfH superfamily antitoxin RatB of RatAB toxin-antitoxin module